MDNPSRFTAYYQGEAAQVKACFDQNTLKTPNTLFDFEGMVFLLIIRGAVCIIDCNGGFALLDFFSYTCLCIWDLQGCIKRRGKS